MNHRLYVSKFRFSVIKISMTVGSGQESCKRKNLKIISTLHSRMVSEMEYHPVIFMPGYIKSMKNIQSLGRKGSDTMPYIAPEVVQEVKRMDLLTYLKNYEPFELVHFSGNTYTTKTHDSLKISNGKWMWWSQGIGGRSALDYLIKVRDYTFIEAVETLAGLAGVKPPISLPAEKKKEKKLLLPEPYRYPTRLVSYLKQRGIDGELVDFCLRTGRVYESRRYHNAVFVGRDKEGKPRYAAIRGMGTDFIGDASGSDKNYSFSIPAEGKSQEVHLFESAIDLLSHATVLKMDGKDWRKNHLLSLAGVYQPAKKIEQSKVPAALTCFLKKYPEVQMVVFHLDNDRAGRLATEAIQKVLPGKYRREDVPPQKGKDCKDELCIRLGIGMTVRQKKQMKQQIGCQERSFER